MERGDDALASGSVFRVPCVEFLVPCFVSRVWDLGFRDGTHKVEGGDDALAVHFVRLNPLSCDDHGPLDALTFTPYRAHTQKDVLPYALCSLGLGSTRWKGVMMRVPSALYLTYSLHRNVQWFRGGLVFEAHRLLYHST